MTYENSQDYKVLSNINESAYQNQGHSHNHNHESSQIYTQSSSSHGINSGSSIRDSQDGYSDSEYTSVYGEDTQYQENSIYSLSSSSIENKVASKRRERSESNETRLPILSLEVVGTNTFYLFIRKYENFQIILSRYFSLIFMLRETVKFIFILFDVKGKYFGLFNSVVVMKYFDKHNKEERKSLPFTRSTSSKSSDNDCNSSDSESQGYGNERNSLLADSEDRGGTTGKITGAILNKFSFCNEQSIHSTNKLNRGLKSSSFNGESKYANANISKEGNIESINNPEVSNAYDAEGEVDNNTGENQHSLPLPTKTTTKKPALFKSVESLQSFKSANSTYRGPFNEESSKLLKTPVKPQKIFSSRDIGNLNTVTFGGDRSRRIKNHTMNPMSLGQLTSVKDINTKQDSSSKRKYKRLYFNECDRLLLFCSCFSKRLRFKSTVFSKTQESLRDFYHEYTSSESNFLINSFIASTYKEKIFNRVFKEFIWDDSLKKDKMQNSNLQGEIGNFSSKRNINNINNINNISIFLNDSNREEDAEREYENIAEINRITLSNFDVLSSKEHEEKEFNEVEEVKDKEEGKIKKRGNTGKNEKKIGNLIKEKEIISGDM
eukprot:CAMPEP_0170540014 /NCGR_PEP_ID=MMETSP0209-20121228/104374_1 /TAXON_ID=665100 ORGANISM="Litonotus pictus, Strain P1" /NCGR_SAMPLE_ID=MMETSP0209 /ASSEMBLY_ACC=CAM_ASM_000301 /LENGTH=606 /DNA_ID=CAMNT_0010842257 /DNA_START=748 /DNA_END=2565 /DNA_ORIENTATION=-